VSSWADSVVRFSNNFFRKIEARVMVTPAMAQLIDIARATRRGPPGVLTLRVAFEGRSAAELSESLLVRDIYLER
jgi:hypothetical protein